MSLYEKLRQVSKAPWFRMGRDCVLKLFRHGYMFAAGNLRGIDDRKVVFSSFYFNNYNDNPRYVSEKLHELAPDVKQVWLLRKHVPDIARVPTYVRVAHPETIDGLRELATARAWVDNVRKNSNMLFRKRRQAYFNTWHGDRGFKCVGKDDRNSRFKHGMGPDCVAMIAGSEFGSKTYRTAFEYEGHVMMDGCPRNDLLIENDRELAASLRKQMGLPEDVRLMVFAPTYRDDLVECKQSTLLDIPCVLDRLQERTGERWLCLMRAHYRSGGLAVNSRDARLVDMTAWPEMAEILLVADLLVTDYSSCAGDFILRDMPAILYQPDIGDYVRGSRDFYFDLEKSPFFIAKDMPGMLSIIDSLNEASVRENCQKWREFFGVTETGRASEALARKILETIKGED